MIKNLPYAILIVTHNHEDYIQKLLDSIEQYKYENVFICDALSSDKTLDILVKSSFKNILKKNKLEGFAKNNNDLIQHFKIQADYFILLNPDTYFNEDIVSSMIAFMQKKSKTAILAPRILYPDGKNQITWKKFPNLLTVLKKRLGFTQDVESYTTKTQKIEWAIGAAMIIRSSMMLSNNMLLDNRYRLYCEDSDLCLSAQIKGFEVWGSGDIVLYHHLQEKSRTVFSKYNYFNMISLVKFFLKWNISYFRYLTR